MEAKYGEYSFKLSKGINRKKVEFHNRYGIKLIGDLYMKENQDNYFGAIAIAGPFGAVKEQCAGFYANELAKRGFLTLAFDPSFIGESGGEARNVASPDINTEDFSAAVDYLLNQEFVKTNNVGILGICGFGGFALNAASMDTRIKACVTSTMYDMSRVNANGYFDAEDSEELRYNKKVALNEQRTLDYRNNKYLRAGGVKDKVEEDAPNFVKDYFDYYKTCRGYTKRSLNSNDGWNYTSSLSFLNMPLLAYINEIRSAVLIIHGSKAHSNYFSKDAFRKMITNSNYKFNKEYLEIPDATHVDLYDRLDKIPFDKIEQFYRKYFNN